MQIPEVMKGIVLTGHGGLDKLEWRENLPVPSPGKNEVLVRIGAAALNNTDINTRTGWYSKSVRGGTDAGALQGYETNAGAGGSWAGEALSFPHIQGADVCGKIVAVGADVSADRVGQRILVRTMQSVEGPEGRKEIFTFGSECNGGFAEYTLVRSGDALSVNSALSDIELASFPCAFSTAEGMIQKAGIGAANVLITGASGGVGSAAIQLAKRRGAKVTAVTSNSKAEAVRELGADAVVERDEPLPDNRFDCVLDLVGGKRWPMLLDALRSGGKYVTSGAIAGPVVELDLRTLYLKDLTLIGSTYQPENIFRDLVGYIERNEIRPVIAEVFDLKELRLAQEAFLKKSFVGKIAIRVAS